MSYILKIHEVFKENTSFVDFLKTIRLPTGFYGFSTVFIRVRNLVLLENDVFDRNTMFLVKWSPNTMFSIRHDKFVGFGFHW